MRFKVAKLDKVLQAVTKGTDEVLWLTPGPLDSLYRACHLIRRVKVLKMRYIG